MPEKTYFFLTGTPFLTHRFRRRAIKKDAECILFLKKQRAGNVPQLASADYWFGVQHPSPWMFKSLRRLANEAIAVDVDSNFDWIRIAKKHVESDKAIQLKIGGLPFDPNKTRVRKNARDGLTIELNYGSLAYDTLWMVTVEMDSKGKVVKTDVKLFGFE